MYLFDSCYYPYITLLYTTKLIIFYVYEDAYMLTMQTSNMHSYEIDYIDAQSISGSNEHSSVIENSPGYTAIPKLFMPCLFEEWLIHNHIHDHCFDECTGWWYLHAVLPNDYVRGTRFILVSFRIISLKLG